MLPSIAIMLADVTLTIRDCYKGRIDTKTRDKLLKFKLGKGAINLTIGALVTAGLIFATGGLFIGIAAGGVALTIAANAGLDYLA